jgi:hypothetical protein
MSPPAKAFPNLLPTAAIVAILVLLLGVIGLFTLSYTNLKSAAALDRLSAFHAAEISAVKAQVSFKTQVQEWKNVLLRGRNPADYQAYFKRFEAQEAAVRANLANVEAQLARLGQPPGATASLLEEHAALGASYRAALARTPPNDPDYPFAVDRSLRGIDRKLNDEIDALAQSVDADAQVEFAGFRVAAVARYGRLRQLTLGFGGAAVLGALWLMYQAGRAGARRPLA